MLVRRTRADVGMIGPVFVSKTFYSRFKSHACARKVYSSPGGECTEAVISRPGCVAGPSPWRREKLRRLSRKWKNELAQ